MAYPEPPSAWFGGRRASGLTRATSDPAELSASDWWAVLITFEGECRFWRASARWTPRLGHGRA